MMSLRISRQILGRVDGDIPKARSESASAASPPRLALEAQLAPLLQKAFCSLLAASDGQRILQFLTVMFGKH